MDREDEVLAAGYYYIILYYITLHYIILYYIVPDLVLVGQGRVDREDEVLAAAGEAGAGGQAVVELHA